MARQSGFPPGLALAAHKPPGSMQPVLEVPPPVRLRYALDQGSGSELEPAIGVGDPVAIGTLIGRSVDEYAAPLHSSVSGRVVAIDALESATDGGWCTCIEVENDFRDTRVGATVDAVRADALDAKALLAGLREAGIAGLGGAAFPTATKLQAAREHGARTLLLNGAECEPWISCDDAVMREEAAGVLSGARLLMRAFAAENCVVAVEDDKPEAIASLRAAHAAMSDAAVEIRVIPAVYPQGAERQLVTAVCGREVPAGGLPTEVGVVCQNVATAAAVARWAHGGEPLVSRVVTVTGSGVASPRNLRARIGTPIEALVAAAGGYRGEPIRLIAGGSMTGRALASDEIGLAKSVNCVLVATREDLGARPGAVELPCIRCGDCASVCPAGLLPQELHRATRARDDSAAVRLGLRDCIDCGCCDYVCPSRIPLAWRFRSARQRLRTLDQAARRAADAKQRFEQHELRLRQARDEERRAFDAARARARGLDPGDPPGESP